MCLPYKPTIETTPLMNTSENLIKARVGMIALAEEFKTSASLASEPGSAVCVTFFAPGSTPLQRAFPKGKKASPWRAGSDEHDPLLARFNGFPLRTRTLESQGKSAVNDDLLIEASSIQNSLFAIGLLDQLPSVAGHHQLAMHSDRGVAVRKQPIVKLP